MNRLFLLLFALVSINGWGQTADFFKEELRFTVDSAYFHMQGDFYLLRNSSELNSMKLSFPVPSEATQFIDSLYVYDYASEKNINTFKIDSVFYFTVLFSDKDTAIFNISYKQKLQPNDSSLTYIITTVGYWGRPLQYASYSLLVPDYIEASSFSLNVDKQLNLGREMLFMWERYSFMPETDFSFKIKWR